MKTKALSLLVLFAVLACSKSSDPATPAGGCTVSFKGATHTLTTVICIDPISGGGVNVDGLGATDAGAKSLNISRDLDDPAGSTVSFATDANDSDTFYYISEGISGTAPTITRNGKSWTFSGTAQNGSGDTGSLSGSCTCTN